MSISEMKHLAILRSRNGKEPQPPVRKRKAVAAGEEFKEGGEHD